MWLKQWPTRDGNDRTAANADDSAYRLLICTAANKTDQDSSITFNCHHPKQEMNALFNRQSATTTKLHNMLCHLIKVHHSPCSSILEAMEREEWETVRLHLRCHFCANKIKTHSKCNSILSLACRKSAPDDIIFQLCVINHLFLLHRDPVTKRYPLHEAASNGSNPDIIRYLVQIFPSATLEFDAQDRTPLHLACMSGWGFDEEVATILCQAGPSALGMECCDGKTPMELIITSGCHVKAEVLDVLHFNTGKYLKATRQSHGCNTQTPQQTDISTNVPPLQRLHRAVSLAPHRSRWMSVPCLVYV